MNTAVPTAVSCRIMNGQRVVRMAAPVNVLLLCFLCSGHRLKQGRNCEGHASDGCGGRTLCSHSACRWRRPTARAIYYRASIFHWYVKDSLLYSPFQFQSAVKERCVFDQAQWIITSRLTLMLGLGCANILSLYYDISTP